MMLPPVKDVTPCKRRYPRVFTSQRFHCIKGYMLVHTPVFCVSIADVSTHRVDVDVALRSSAGGVGVSASVSSVAMTGRSVGGGGDVPQIISTNLKSSGM